MLFDQFDKKIKEAAEQHHPAYDEKAWKKMENLLNLHLPKEKKDRRRIFLLIFTFLLLGGGVFVIVSRTGGDHTKQVAQENKNSINKTTDLDTKAKTSTAQPQTEKINNEISGNKIQSEEKTSTTPGLNDNISQQLLSPNQNLTEKRTGITRKQNSKSNNLSNGNPIEQQTTGTVLPEVSNNNSAQLNPKTSTPSNTEVTSNESKLNEPSEKKDEVKTQNDQQPQVNSQKKSPQRIKQPNRNGLSFYVSAGPDVSKAGASKAGKMTLTYGLGVDYTINRVTIKTGVFEANKKYWAGPDEYELSWTPPNTKFEGADADCQVIVIPLKAYYNFAFNKKGNWFAGGGLSSYLMKSEKYMLEYTTGSGSPYYHPYETKNENKHYFSILNLSAGYSRQLNKTFSISAEPYLEIPMSGIGAGKIHLNSAGLLFTVGVSPFRK